MASLPNGCFVDIDGAAYLVWGDELFRWSPEGYVSKEPRADLAAVTVLTPAPIVECFRAGYVPRSTIRIVPSSEAAGRTSSVWQRFRRACGCVSVRSGCPPLGETGRIGTEKSPAQLKRVSGMAAIQRMYSASIRRIAWANSLGSAARRDLRAAAEIGRKTSCR